MMNVIAIGIIPKEKKLSSAVNLECLVLTQVKKVDSAGVRFYFAPTRPYLMYVKKLCMPRTKSNSSLVFILCALQVVFQSRTP